MPETSQANPEGVERTPTGEIADKTPAQATPESKETTPAKTEQGTPKPGEEKGKSLLNEGKKDDKTDPTGAPAAYTEFKVPEGFTLDEAVAKEAGELFKGMNLDQTQAQSLVDFYVAKTKEAAEAPMNFYLDKQEEWKTQIKADPEIGGKLDQVRTTISKAIDGLGDPKLATEFREAMDYTGAGNNPAFIRAFYKLAQMVTEGGAVQGRGPVAVRSPTGQPASAARALYPNLP